LRSREAVGRLFKDLAPLFSARNGGYTRIIKYKNRHGDNAPMAIIEWTESVAAKAPEKKALGKKSSVKKVAQEKKGSPEKKVSTKRATEKKGSDKVSASKKTTRKNTTDKSVAENRD